MDEEAEFSEEVRVMFGIVNEIMLTNSACRMLTDARCEALVEAVTTMAEIRPSDTTRPSPEALRGYVDNRMKEILNGKLAALADDSQELASTVHRLFDGFLVSKKK